MICLGNMCMDTLHKVDNDDNNNNNKYWAGFAIINLAGCRSCKGGDTAAGASYPFVQ